MGSGALRWHRLWTAATQRSRNHSSFVFKGRTEDEEEAAYDWLKQR